MWSGEGDLPPLLPVLAMTTSLYQMGASFSVVTVAMVKECDHTPSSLPDDLEGLCVSVGSKCQQLAVAVLSMLRTSQHGKTLSAHVQTLSQRMAKAAKRLNHSIKTATPHATYR